MYLLFIVYPFKVCFCLFLILFFCLACSSNVRYTRINMQYVHTRFFICVRHLYIKKVIQKFVLDKIEYINSSAEAVGKKHMHERVCMPFNVNTIISSAHITYARNYNIAKYTHAVPVHVLDCALFHYVQG